MRHQRVGLKSQTPGLQGKVRRMRPSPFNKTSGQAKAAAAPPGKSRMAPLETSSADEGEVPPAPHTKALTLHQHQAVIRGAVTASLRCLVYWRTASLPCAAVEGAFSLQSPS